jgi:hypothetical protein
MLSNLENAKQNTIRRTTLTATLGWIAGWVWAIVAGGGGLLLLLSKGPWPLTNGWFALFSGISACPATGWFLKKYAGIAVSGYVQLFAAALFFVVGRIALVIGR